MARAKPNAPLRRGWTTGACATAAASAAYAALLGGRFPDPVEIELPGGQRPRFPLSRSALHGEMAEAGVIKDAGDDPDVTHGCEVVARVRRNAPGGGVRFHAGEGVGTVTLPGLPLPVGEPAINPAPRAMMAGALAALAREAGQPCDLAVTIAIPGGEELARRTTNGRLGIAGGLSVLGTTGVVIPYSCASWIHSIHRGIDVARALGFEHIGAATGRTSEAGLRRLTGLPDTALMDMGDFAGGLLKYLRRHPVPRLTMGGGFAKIAKLAAGHLDLHSARSSVDVAALTEHLRALNAPAETVAVARDAHSAGAVLAAAGPLTGALADRVAAGARAVVLATLAGGTAVDVVVFNRAGKLIGHAGA